MNNPKILDIDFDSIMKEFFIGHKKFDEKGWSEFWEGYKNSPIIEDIKVIIALYRRHIKSACEFYLKYKDDPDLFITEHPEYKEEIEEEKREFQSVVENMKQSLIPDIVKGIVLSLGYKEYNEWLFKLAFRDILSEEKRNEGERVEK